MCQRAHLGGGGDGSRLLRAVSLASAPRLQECAPEGSAHSSAAISNSAPLPRVCQLQPGPQTLSLSSVLPATPPPRVRKRAEHTCT